MRSALNRMCGSLFLRVCAGDQVLPANRGTPRVDDAGVSEAEVTGFHAPALDVG